MPDGSATPSGGGAGGLARPARLDLRELRPPVRRREQRAVRSRRAHVRRGRRRQRGNGRRGDARRSRRERSPTGSLRSATRCCSASASRWAAASRSSSRDGTRPTTASPCSASARSRPCCRFRRARRAMPTRSRRATTVSRMVTWCFHYDDEPADIVDEDMRGYPMRAAHAGVGLGDDAAECDRDGRARLRA